MAWKIPKIPRPKIVDKWLGTDRMDRKKISPFPDLARLQELQRQRIAQLLEKRNDKGWSIDTCDAMLWQGKLGAVTLSRDIRAANHWPEDPGRFGRRSSGPCWDGEDKGAKATWSRDMGIGLIWWAWRTGDVSVLSDHIKFGVDHAWKMGNPLADGRVLYTPNMLGLLYSAYDKLSGSKHVQATIGGIYSDNLSDYEAHLAVMGILLKGEIDGFIWRRDLKILEEQARKQSKAPLYEVALALYTGRTSSAVQACFDPEYPDYISSNERDICQLIDVVFSTDLLLRAVR